MTASYRNRLARAVWAYRFGRYDDMPSAVVSAVLADAAERLLIESDEPVPLTKAAECDGWAVHPENGLKPGVRCPHGCPSRCSVCGNANCDNPNGQH